MFIEIKRIIKRFVFLIKKIIDYLTNKKIKDENKKLRYQVEYLKRHCDIESLKPATGWLRDFQLKELEFALEVISILNKKEIYPFFDAGSLLGVIRHKGFVPWDDDIDLGVTRKEFNNIIEISKNEFVWIDTSNIKINFLQYTDDAITQNPNKYVAIRTPYCLHIYKGTSLKESLNVEFFPFDYVKDNISEENFCNYINEVKSKIDLSKPWKNIFDYYDEELSKNVFFTEDKTTRITPGLNHYALTQYKFYGFRTAKDYLPLTTKEFENQMVPVPNNAEEFLEKNYSSWKEFPNDFGISHDLEALNIYLNQIKQ